MKLRPLTRFLPDWKSAGLAVLSAILLILAFPDFEFWFLAWFGMLPLLWAVEREKESAVRAFVLGWIWGIIFFFGTCWWLTYAPITYAAFPPLLAYFLLFCVTVVAGLFPALFAGILAHLLKRFGHNAMLAAPFVWVFTEFLRYWLTGNNWNAIGYSQAFETSMVQAASVGGVLLVGFLAVFVNAVVVFNALIAKRDSAINKWISFGTLILAGFSLLVFSLKPTTVGIEMIGDTHVVAVQPNVPMSGLNREKWLQLRQKHVHLAESALRSIKEIPHSALRTPHSTTVVFPESPMNFMYGEDPEFQAFVSDFAERHNVNVLFNSAEPDPEHNKYFNSAVLVNTEGREIAQYDKIYLVPFGESVPAPLQSIVPAFVGSFSYGKEYDLLPLGDARGGVMICFESHFGELSREYVRRGADVIIEMTNDGYLGPTPVLRQHLANAVFRAVETNRPVLRVTNVGITAYITERGEVLDATDSYTEASRVWNVSKSDGSQTFYVRYGDWFAWLCSVVTVGLIGYAVFRRRQ